MKWSFLFLLLASSLLQAADEAAQGDWSKPVNGLRARLLISPSHEPEYDKTFDVSLELQEMGIDTSLGLAHHALTVRFTRDELACSVADAKGQSLPKDARPGNEDGFLVPTWDLILPPNGQLSFPVGWGGSSPHADQPQQTGRLLSFGNIMTEWLIPFATGPYSLSGTLTVPFAPGSPTGDSSMTMKITTPPPAPGSPHDPPYRGWRGTLILPPVEIPKR